MPDDLPIAGAGDQVASEGAVNAKGRPPLKVPAPALETGRLIRVDAGGAEVDEVSGKGTFQRAVLVPTKIGTAGDLHGAQVAVAGKFLIETAAPLAVDAAVHLVLNEDAQVLVTVGPLLPGIAPQPVAAGHGHILKEAVSPFIADRAVMGVIHHEPLDDMSSEIHGLVVGGRDDHAVLGIDHAAHLNALDRSLQKFHRTHPAGADRPEAG